MHDLVRHIWKYCRNPIDVACTGVLLLLRRSCCSGLYSLLTLRYLHLLSPLRLLRSLMLLLLMHADPPPRLLSLLISLLISALMILFSFSLLLLPFILSMLRFDVFKGIKLLESWLEQSCGC